MLHIAIAIDEKDIPEAGFRLLLEAIEAEPDCEDPTCDVCGEGPCCIDGEAPDSPPDETRSPAEILIDRELHDARMIHAKHNSFAQSAKVVRNQTLLLLDAVDEAVSVEAIEQAAIRVGAMARRFLEDVCQVPASFEAV